MTPKMTGVVQALCKPPPYFCHETRMPRHSFASNLAVAGIDQRMIDRWMRHTTEEMRRRYQHLFPKKLAESIRALSYEYQ